MLWCFPSGTLGSLFVPENSDASNTMSAPPAAVPSHRIIGMTATKATIETQQLKYVYMIKEVCLYLFVLSD